MIAREFVLMGAEIQSGYMGEAATKPTSVIELLNQKATFVLLFLHMIIYTSVAQDCRQGISGGISLVQCWECVSLC